MIIEHVTFRLADGVDEHDFLAADTRVQREVVPHCKGFVRRTTARGVEGRWMVQTCWFDEQTCAAASMVTGDAVTAFTRCIDASTMTHERWTTLD